MKRSEQINELASALAKAQKALGNVEKTHTAKVQLRDNKGSYTFDYANLADYLEVIRDPLADNGLAFMQEAVSEAGKVSVTTHLWHSSGQWLEASPLIMPLAEGSTPQALGSAITYAKRYSLSALLGMASEDDDGNAASGNQANIQAKQALPACPQCKKTDSVIRGKEEYGGGLVCWGNKGGCGYKWQPEAAPVETNGDTAPEGEDKDVIEGALRFWAQTFENDQPTLAEMNSAEFIGRFRAIKNKQVRAKVWAMFEKYSKSRGWGFIHASKRFEELQKAEEANA